MDFLALPKIWNMDFFPFAKNLNMDFPPLGQESGVSKVYMYFNNLFVKNHCIRRSMSPDTPGRPAAVPSGSSIVALLGGDDRGRRAQPVVGYGPDARRQVRDDRRRPRVRTTAAARVQCFP